MFKKFVSFLVDVLTSRGLRSASTMEEGPEVEVQLDPIPTFSPFMGSWVKKQPHKRRLSTTREDDFSEWLR